MVYILRRLGLFAATLWACLTINFFLPRLMPGNPAIAMMARYRGRVSPQTIHALEIAFGVSNHQNVLIQYLEYLGNTAQGRFGTSLTFFPESVDKVIITALPWTLGLVGLTTILSFVLGTLLGMLSAWRRGGRILDSTLPPVFIIFNNFPPFTLGLLLILFFAVVLGWLPLGFAYGGGQVPALTWQFVGNVLGHALLPSLTLLVVLIGGWILTMRNNMITTLAEDYVRMARAKGLSPWRIMVSYAGRNAILPNFTGFAMSMGFVVSGAIFIEYVFSYPGVGYMLLQAVSNEDYALMQALFLMITVAVLVSVLAADLINAWLDPRARTAS
ncbi:MAG: ABC transporter permease [Candidatus Dormiibacterota bacterium]|jgi:peptide/nickel transport system permease protein